MILTVLPMLVCVFWTLFLLTSFVETRNRAKGRLALFMLVATLLYGGHYVFFNRYTSFLPLSDTVYVYANLAVFPLFLQYIDTLTVQRHAPAWWQLMMEIVPFVVASSVLVVYAQMTPAETQQFVDACLYHNSMEGLEGMTYVQGVIHLIAKVLFGIEIIPVFVIGNRQLIRYEHELEANYADLEDKSLQPLRFMLMLFATVSVFSFVSNIVGRHQFVSDSLLLAVPSLGFSFFLYYLGYLGHRLQGIDVLTSHFYDKATEETAETSEKGLSTLWTRDILEPYPDLPLRERIERLMSVDHIFLQPNLKISDLALRLNSNRSYIYEAVNVDMGISFNEYVNRHRVSFAQQLLQEQPALLLSEVAARAGFSSSVSFYRSFKKYVGSAPKEWIVLMQRGEATFLQPLPEQKHLSDNTSNHTQAENSQR